MGVMLTVAQADVSDLERMPEVINGITAKHPLKGVIHSTGILADAVISHQDEERFIKAMTPKVLGGWNLHQLTKDKELDFFVLYSSAASLLGSPGQANYSSANAFLDSLAGFRQANGLPATSINWGAWSEIGLAARAKSQDKPMSFKGIEPIDPASGLRALEEVLKSKDHQTAVIPIDWSVFSNYTSDKFYTNVRSADLAEEAAGLFIHTLEKLPDGEKSEALIGYIQQQLGSVLGVTNYKEIELDTGFFELGMDSLTSMEFRNILQKNFECSLATTIIFDCPTPTDLIRYLSEEILDTRIEMTKESEDQDDDDLDLIDDLVKYTN